jgi:hypothetical protein
MGNYSLLRFKGVVKKEYRESMNRVIGTTARWEDTKIVFLQNFVEEVSTDAILLGGYGYEWNKLNGEWTFEVELKIPVEFFGIIPLLMDSVDKCEVWDDEEYWDIYALKNGVVVKEETKYMEWEEFLELCEKYI